MTIPSGSASTCHPPSLEELLDRERVVRHKGSGLEQEDLRGSWILEQVWSKGRDSPDQLSSFMLRTLGARLEIGTPQTTNGFTLKNSVRLGALQLRFEGNANLKGSRPLMIFQFEHLKIMLGNWKLADVRLSPADGKRLPFFALIATGPAEGSGHPAGQTWLAARGRGGGLALWLRQEP